MLVYVLDKPFINKYFYRLFDFKAELDEYSSGRLTIYKYGLEQWKNHPIFGVGWMECKVQYFVFPARYHDTYVQLLAATGSLGLIAYLYHRFETLLITFKKPSLEKTFALLLIMGLMLSSSVDCYFFNIWPGFSYAFLLAFIEGMNIREQK